MGQTEALIVISGRSEKKGHHGKICLERLWQRRDTWVDVKEGEDLVGRKEEGMIQILRGDQYMLADRMSTEGGWTACLNIWNSYLAKCG